MKLTQEQLKKLLDYNPETGIFTWKVSLGTRARSGRKAGGTDTHGYTQIGISRKLHLAHRLAWLYMTGEWPTQQVEHHDTNRKNNSWLNLRLASNKENTFNQKRRTTNSSGFKGVHWDRKSKRYRAKIQSNVLGYFNTPEAAYEAYCRAGRELFGEFFNAG